VLSAGDLGLAQSQGVLRALPVTGTVLLSADVVFAGTGRLFVQPFILRTVKGHRVALLGLTGTVASAQFRSLDPVEAVTQALAQVQAAADIVILLSNAGLDVDRQLAARVPGLDAILGGGDPPLDEPEQDARTGTLILRTGYAGRSIGVARLAFDAEGQLQHYAWERRLFTLTP